MPHGFFTVEQWKPRRRGGRAEWVAILHLDAGGSVSATVRAIERRGRAGFFRVVQTQRQVWAERVDGRLRLRQWHADSPAALARSAKAFVKDKGVWPDERRQRNRGTKRKPKRGAGRHAP